MWPWIRVICPGRQTRATIENDPVRLDVQVVGAVVVGGAEALRGGQHVQGGQVPAQLVGDELRGLGPVGMALYGGADSGDEWAQPGGGADLSRGHALSLRAIASYVQCLLSY